MNIAVIGGGGYLGSTIEQELKKHYGVKVTIFDNALFCDEYLKNKDYEHVNILNNIPDFSGFDRIIWCCDIDVPMFYNTEFSKDYIKANINSFEKMCKQYKKKMYWIQDHSHNGGQEYQKMLDTKKNMISKVGGQICYVGQLYGPSGRMRFDTVLNEMFVMAVTEGNVFVDDWLDHVCLQSVAVVAEYIASDVLLKKAELNYMYFSKIELAYRMALIFKRKIGVVASDNMGTHNRPCISGVKDDDRYSIEKSFTYMCEGLERGALDSVVKDSYNNSRIIANFIASDNFFKFKTQIIG